MGFDELASDDDCSVACGTKMTPNLLENMRFEFERAFKNINDLQRMSEDKNDPVF